MKIWIKVINLVMIVSIMFLNIPNEIKALENGEIKNNIIKVGSLDSEGDVEVIKTVEKVDNNEYQVTFDIKGNDVLKNQVKDNYTVFVLDASMSMKGDKWKYAKLAAINFSKALVKNSNNYLALVTFNGKSYPLRDFKNEVFDNNFGNLSYFTNYNQGLDEAYKYLNKINQDVIKNIVFISDGEPNLEDYHQTLQKIKDDNINIYALAYDLKENSDAYKTIKEISTNNYVYSVGIDDISDVLNEVALDIIKLNAGKNAVLTDIIGDNFNFVSGDVTLNGKKVTYDIGDITSSGTSFSFNIKAYEDLDTNWYPTNNGFTLNYTDYNNEEKTLETLDSALVYVLSDRLDYTVNYYNDEEFIGSIVKKTKKGSVITDVDIDTSLFKGEGYILKSVNPDSLIINDNNVFNVVYTKRKDLSYQVNYYFDDTLDNTVKYDNVEYGIIPTYEELDRDGYSLCLVTGNNEEIIDNDTVIDVYYCRNSYPYHVNYYYDNKLEETIDYEGKYNDLIDVYDDKLKEGYELDYIENIPLNITSGDNNINVYYKLKDIKYTVNYLDDNNNIIESKESIGKYHDEVVEEFRDIKNYKLVSDDKVSIILDDDNNIINFYYELKHGNITIKYVDENNNKISDDTIISGNYGDNYSVSIKDINGYNYKDSEFIEGIIDEDNKIITLMYHKETIKDVMAPLTGISNNKYIYIFITSLLGISSLLIFKLYRKLTKKCD